MQDEADSYAAVKNEDKLWPEGKVFYQADDSLAPKVGLSTNDTANVLAINT